MTTRPQTRYWLQYNVGSRPQVWAVIGDEAHGLFPLKTGEPRQLGGHLALWDVIPNSKVGDFVEISIAADKFYRRIARPIVGGNAVKHDRELSFSVGNIEAVFNAVAACAIMLFAQFGFQGLGYQGIGESGLLEYFSFSKIPEWRNDECYVLLGREVEPASINYPWPPSSS